MWDVRSLNEKFAKWPDEWPLTSSSVLDGRIMKIDGGCIAGGGYWYVGGIIVFDERRKRQYSIFFYPETELFSLLEIHKPKVGDRIVLKYLGWDKNGCHFDLQLQRCEEKTAEGEVVA